MRGYDVPPCGIRRGVQGPTTARRKAMCCQAGFAQWRRTIMQHLPHLSKPQATGFAWWSVGMVLARSCAWTTVRHLLAQGLQRKDQTVRQQRRAWDDDTPRKRGAKRPALHVETCCPVWLGGVVSWGQGTPRALALDATALAARCVVVAVRVVSRGGASPGAWVVLPANTQHAWRREGRRRRRRRRPAGPRPGTVLGLAARGWEAPWRCRRMVRLGWHPFLRSKTGGSLRPTGATCGRPVAPCAPCPGPSWRGAGSAFARHQVPCTVLARWEAG